MKFLVTFLLLIVSKFAALAAVETIPTGSFIVNLGITPQNKANGLKPYGLVYDMLQNFKVPVKWIINPNKSRDGKDFSYNGVDYKGSAFVVLAKYRTDEVNTAIDKWKLAGVVGANTTSSVDLDVFETLTYAPNWTLDKSLGSLIVSFFDNAGIPSSAYGGSSQSSWKNPSELGECDDIFVLPHADPTFNTHKNLLDWNRDYKGAIWSGCHAVSVLENIGLNFLTTSGMVNYSPQHDGTPPYDYKFPADPVMQFMGSQDGASLNGSENTYFPSINSQWRPGVKLYISDPTNNVIPAKSAGPGGVLALGKGFGDENRGYVMYQGGHFHNGGTSPLGGFSGFPFFEDHVALQRTFFNFSFLAVIDRQKRNVAATIVAPKSMITGKSYPITFTLPPGTDINKYEISWQASSGTISPSASSKEITYTVTSDPNIKIALLTLILKDGCGRQFFTTYDINLQCPPLDFEPTIVIGTDILTSDKRYDVAFTVPAAIDIDAYSIKWSVSTGKFIAGTNKMSIIYTPPIRPTEKTITFKVTLADNCGNEYDDEIEVPINYILVNNGEVTGVKLVSANNDGAGYDYLYFHNLHFYANNVVTIFNRWGNEVSTIKNYDNVDHIFKGIGINGKEVPDGVYYYLLKIDDPAYSTMTTTIKGYFVLKR